ncbi:uncharacterized protein LOC126584326 [Malus sylvestris]|uniref:uncharacterized protein LOC126584326 n=1 Tax=Malus sylvestris TaxID=3752 RepID=UPI0021ABC6B6|nr:uncharacterized protein LOC126584326 [Malus sylvestris]
MVSDLIDPSSNSWRTEMISDEFNQDDVLPILSIPLSQVGIDDRLVWYHTTDEVYSVKTGDNADEICQDFAFGLWRLWKNRNEVVFNGIHGHPLEILETWRKSTTKYRAFVAPEPANNCHRVTKPITDYGKTSGMWQKPRYETIKIYTDAAWCKNTMHMGVGWLGRDFAGLLQATGGSGVGYCHSAAAAEAIAIRAALMACIDHRFDDVIIESNARSIILMLKKEVVIDFSIECILGDIDILEQKLMSVSFAFVSREGNRAAHSVAKYVFKDRRSLTWDCIGPAFLFNFLA